MARYLKAPESFIRRILHNCIMPYSFDDTCVGSNKGNFTENIDYMGKAAISNFHLFTCWKENNSISIKSAHDDICVKIPSSISKRLENISWRRLDKQLWSLGEVSPAHINWNKSQDVTWLYGPKYLEQNPFDDSRSGQRLTTANLSKINDDVPDMELDDMLSLTSASSMSFDEQNSISLAEQEAFDIESYTLKSALKRRRSPFAREQKSTRKLVKFNYIVNSREIIDGYRVDYDFFDTQCL